MRTIAILFPLYLLVCNLCSCETKSSDASHAAMQFAARSYKYDPSEPASVCELPKGLKEVSGGAWIDANHLLMIEDLHPDLYLLRLGKEGVIEKLIPFLQEEGKKFDIEDVAVSGDTAYALWSHGVIYRINNWRDKPSIQRWETGLSKENNTEGLCYDPVSHNLLIACKNKSGDDEEKKSTRAVYMFDIRRQQRNTAPFLLIKKKDFVKRGYPISGFFPSAIAVHPKTHDVYILSTRETKAMAVYSYKGVLRSLQIIDKDLMPQPEGICFSDKGDLYITTEGKHGEPAKAFRFRCLNIR